VLFHPEITTERDCLLELLHQSNTPVRHVVDTIAQQLDELVRARHPELAGGIEARQPHVATLLQGRPPEEYGVWVWYPWSETLVHLLPKDAFRFLRSNRNRNKITGPQQDALREATIGVVGLSVGSSIAMTCAMEGVGDRFRLADMDALDLTNLNRLRARVQDLGLAKSVLAARQMFEVDPYLDIELFPDGLTDDTADAFFADRVDVVFDECDDLYAKFRVRELARERRTPVIMCTDDRGMMDVERFDLEPERPLLHGRVGDMSAAQLRQLPPDQKLPLVVTILGGASPALRSSLEEVGKTLVSYPQLASEAALAGAQGTEFARRLILGHDAPSGRFYAHLAADNPEVADAQEAPKTPQR